MNRGELIRDVLDRHLADPAAIEFIQSWHWLTQYCDDIIDGDAAWREKDRWALVELALCDFPTNPFYLQHGFALSPLMRQALHQYRQATIIELAAKECAEKEEFEASDDCHAYRLLRHSFELRNTYFDLAVACVERVHGRDVARVFSTEWYPLTRLYETFDEYVGKVTCMDRPQKPEYPRSRPGYKVFGKE